MKKALFACFSLSVAAFCWAGPLEELMPRPKFVQPANGTWTWRAEDIQETFADFDSCSPMAGVAGAYTLTIDPEGVTIASADEAGARYARVTLEQIRALTPKGSPLPCATIEDYPTLRYRGLLHDTGRNWQPISSLKQQIDWLAAYKFNVFQWHITDNHGWRLQSAAYPILSKPAGLQRSTKFYTTKEFKDLIAYAQSKGVIVIPEFDVPGHSESFRRAFKFKRMDEPRVREIITTLLTEASELLDPKVTPFVHLGSDEVQPHERVPDEWLLGWINLFRDKGFKVVAWGPGQTPKGLTSPLIRQYWQGRQVGRPTNEDYFDSQSSFYINHVDPEEMLAAAAFLKPCLTSSSEHQLGGIFAVWHDDNVRTYEDIYTMNPVYPAIVLFSDTFWNGRDKDVMKYYGNLPEPTDPDYKLPADLEKRLLAHKPLFGKLPFPYYPQSQYRWRLAESNEALPFEQLPWQKRVLAQATIYPQHFFYSQTNLVSGKIPTVWLGMVVNSDRDRTVPFIADCMNFSRSEGRSREVATVQGKWNPKGAEIYLNGKPVPPPTWKQVGVKNKEVPLVDEIWTVRKPQMVHLKKGENTLLIKLPKKGWKWSATAIFPDLTGLTFSAPEAK